MSTQTGGGKQSRKLGRKNEFKKSVGGISVEDALPVEQIGIKGLPGSG